MSTPAGNPHRSASKLAQLLADVIVRHAPHTARVNAAATRSEVNDWLEGLERHQSSFIAPFLQQVLDTTSPPPAVAALLEEAISPQAQFTSTITSIFLWGIISSIVGTSVSPFLQGITNDLSSAAVSEGIARPVDPGNLATAAGRGFNIGDAPTVTIPAELYAEAAKSGISADDLNLVASLVGLPPALQELFEMRRRGIITDDQVAQGLREGDFRDDWIQYAVQLIHGWLSPGDFVRAAIQAQLPYADAQTWAASTGLDVTTPIPLDTDGTELTPDMFGLAVALGGRPPGPQELGRMALRGIIPWTGTGAGVLSFQQGIAESDVKTKWTDALQALEQYVPPPRMVGSLFEHGAITEEQALQYWQDGGVPANLAQGFLYAAQQQHIGQEKLLARGDITTAYYDGILTNEQATEALGLLGLSGQVAADILAITDYRREIKAIDSVVTKVGTYYQGFKLTEVAATAALAQVGIPQEQITNLLATWSALRVAPARVPTVTEIGKALQYGTITEPEALVQIEALGYQPLDAQIVLSANSEQQIAPQAPFGTTTTG